jgi:AraC-like DNA-binding protein
MREITIHAPEQFLELSSRLPDPPLDARREDQLWRFELPSLSGVVLDATSPEEFSLNRIKVHAPGGAQLSGKAYAENRMIKLAWVTDGAVRYEISGARRDYDAFGGTCYVVGFNGEVKTGISIEPGQSVSGLSLTLSARRFEQIISTSGVVLHDALAECLYAPSRVPFKFATVMPAAFAAAVSGAFHAVDRAIGAPPAVLEPMIVSTMVILNEECRWPARVVSPSDLERVRTAREILCASLADPPAVRELAHRVGINEFKLKAGFRQAYGTSATAVLHEARMQAARKLLEFGVVSVSEAAVRVGYGNAGDFSVRFRTRFGVSPSGYRRRSTP